MSDGAWIGLLRDFVGRRIDERTFHDRFFDAWHALSARDFADPPPAPVETLFYAVEAYCPDPSLRMPGSPFEADETELHNAAATALAELGGRPSR